MQSGVRHEHERPSPRTDSFAFGLLIIELLSGLTPVEAREMVDGAVSSNEIPELIGEHHGEQISHGFASFTDPRNPMCRWPEEAVQQLGVLAASCVRKEAELRAELGSVVADLEAVAAAAASLDAGAAAD